MAVETSGQRWLTGLLLFALCLLLANAETPRNVKGRMKRLKRSSFSNCPKDIHLTAPKGSTCAPAHWTPPKESITQHSGGDPGDCYSEGEHQVKYTYHGIRSWHWINGDHCDFKIFVTVLYCTSSAPSISNGHKRCNGGSASERLYGTRCTYTCNSPGYQLQGSPSVTCDKPSPSASIVRWNGHAPTCAETCSWPKNHCWPGDCSQQLASNCVCRPGFKSRSVRGGRRCDLDTPPVMYTCRVSVFDASNNEMDSKYTGALTDCSHQRDEVINTQPNKLHFKISAYLPPLDLSVGNHNRYIHSSDVGMVGTKVTVVQVALDGTERVVKFQPFNKAVDCQTNVDSRHPVNNNGSLVCEADINFTVGLSDGEKLCVDMESLSGGFYVMKNEATNIVIRGPDELFTPVSTKKRVCFLYDPTPPNHCSDQGCGLEPLKLSTRVTRVPEISVHVEGWSDPIPARGNQFSAAGVKSYELEVHNALVDTNPVAVELGARDVFTRKWNANVSSSGTYDITFQLPPEEPRMYAILLKVHDNARVDTNVAYARRFVLYDNSSIVSLNGSLTAISASFPTQHQWQTDVQQPLCVEWKGCFYNSAFRNTFLNPIKQDLNHSIIGHYEQSSGLLPVSGTENVDGIVRFEMSWKREGELQSLFTQVTDLHAQQTCLSEPLKDGETYTVWIRASDVMNHTQTISTTVHVDHSGPQVTVQGLRGRLNTQGLYVHGSTKLSAMTLGVHVADPHSATYTFEVAVGTTYLADDVAHSAVGIQRLNNVTNCAGQTSCYCPDVGPCENDNYVLSFNNIVNVNNSKGLHHREYYITINITNNARLRTTRVVDILIDASPPTKGVVWEGLDDDNDKAEMDFTSQNVAHVRWHGFHDVESDVRLYRVALAERCLTVEEMESNDNVTQVERDRVVTLTFPAEGRYFTSIVAYNGAMSPSEVACSDGITFDSTPPKLFNVSLYNSRTGQSIACTQNNEAWLINANFTKARLSPTPGCLNACSASTSAISVDHIPATSNAVLEKEMSEDLCQRLSPMKEDHALLLPSDVLKLEWAGQDEESDMEEYFVGMGGDRTTSTAPDLMSFTPTHGHHSYHGHHTGLGHGAKFYVFLQAVNKAGLDILLTLGPVIIDVTAPDVTKPLVAAVDDGYLVVMWTNGTFSDPEQPDDTDFDVSFRVGHEDGYVTPVLSLPQSSFRYCLQQGFAGCVRYPVRALYTHDTPQGRPFFLQIHVTNAAGHVTSVNSSSVRLPAHTPPEHGMVMDVIRLTAAATTSTSTTTATTPSTEKTSSSNGLTNSPQNFTTQNATNVVTTLPSTTKASTLDKSPEFSKDVDIILHKDEICIAWSGFYHAEGVVMQVGVGSSANQDDVGQFISVENKSPACINATALPVYTQLFSVVKATSPGGSSLFSSDGFRLISEQDSDNVIQISNGIGCSDHDIIGTVTVLPGNTVLELGGYTKIPVHPGDNVFVQFEPLQTGVSFPDDIVLHTSLTGYQVVVKSGNLTVNLPTSIAVNTTIQIMNCLMDASILPDSSTGFDVTIDTAGRWSGMIKEKKVDVVDETCVKRSVKKRKYTYQQCLVSSTTLAPSTHKATLKGDILPGHYYTTTVTPCFDDGCLPSASSNMVLYDSDTRIITFPQATVKTLTSQQIEMQASCEVQPAIRNISDHNQPCLFKWGVSKDRHGSRTVADWQVDRSSSCSDIKIHQTLDIKGPSSGTLYLCLQLIHPLKSEHPTCQTLQRRRSQTTSSSFHLIELDRNSLYTLDTTPFLHSQNLGSKLHQIYDLDVDVISSRTHLAALLTNGGQRNVTWFLMTNQRVPVNGDCVTDLECVKSKTTNTGTVIFTRAQSALRDGRSFYVCALVSPRSSDQGQGHMLRRSEVCGNGVAVDDSPPVPGSVAISNTVSGYLSSKDHVMVVWNGFADGSTLGTHHSLNYSVALGSYPGSEDIAYYMSVGQRTTWTFDQMPLSPGLTCIATVKAEDRQGHVTQVSSSPAIIDNTPPSVGRVIVGTSTRGNFVSGQEFPVQWETVEDKESGIKHMEVCVVSEGGQTVVPFQPCHGQLAVFNTSGQLTDGHSYVVLFKVTNHAGLFSIKSSDPFIVDSTPPGPGVVWNSGSNMSTHSTYSHEMGLYRVWWSGFTDPHSGLAYFRVGLGSSPGQVDIHPFLYVGLQTSHIWKHSFDQGKKYYVTMEACNQVGLCRMASSPSMTFDNSPPLPGLVTVGLDGRCSKFLGHNTSLAVQWAGFSDPQTRVADICWCVGKSPELCDVISVTCTVMSRGTLTSGLSLPVATPLYATVRAKNRAGLETVSVSDSFQVDPTPPEVITIPHFVSPREGSRVLSQWDRSTLRLAWKFWDPESTVVSHTISIRSKLTGRLLIDPVHVTTDTELTISLKSEELLEDGDYQRAAVTACNAAGICTISLSEFLLIDSSPPVATSFLSPLSWTSSPTSNASVLALRLVWNSFYDPESDILAYYIMVGRVYNGDSLSQGAVKVFHDNTTTTQSHTVKIQEELNSGDVVYLSIRAENQLGLSSETVRMGYKVVVDSSSKTSGSLVLIRHSCDVAYCTLECSCAARGQRCPRSSPCTELHTTDPSLSGVSLILHIGLPSAPQAYSTSSKCLEGHWLLTDPAMLQNVSRFEWSFSLVNKTEGEGVFVLGEPVWHDVGRDTHALHCLPGHRVLESGLRYVLHVRVWLSRDVFVTFTSDPVVTDHTPPVLKKRKRVMESDVSCTKDLDYITTESEITACWGGLFRDPDSAIARYEVWIGTTQYGSDHVDKTDTHLSTSLTIPTATMEEGTRYYVTVRAWNEAGLHTTMVSDGVMIDVTPPVLGVVFPSRHHRHQHAQSSASSLSASWHGFEDRHSGVASYHAAIYDVSDVTVPVVPFTNVGIVTQFVFQGVSLKHGHRYHIAVKAKDKAGLESLAVNSDTILIDTTSPKGVSCSSFHLQDETTLTYTPTTSFHHDSYHGTLDASNLAQNELVKLELSAVRLEPGAGGFFGVGEKRMPVYFNNIQLSSEATTEHEFVTPEMTNSTLTIVVEGNQGAVITAKLYRCNQANPDETSAVAIQQISENVISVCARVLDKDSGLRSFKVGVGTTEGGLQIQPWTIVGHSGVFQFNVHVQHAATLYASVIAENHASQWSRFLSQPIVMDRTGPEVSDVKVTVDYAGEDHVGATLTAWVVAQWTASDAESHVMSCGCQLEGHHTSSPTQQTTNDVTPGTCRWLLEEPLRHRGEVTVKVTCVNHVHLHTTVTSVPVTILLHPPDVSQVSIRPLSNSESMSPFEVSSPDIQSSSSSIQFYWHGLTDPTVTHVDYRFLHHLQPLTEWRPLPVMHTMTIIEKGEGGGFPQGDLTLQLRAFNDRHMVSDIVSGSVVVDDTKPTLTGNPAAVTQTKTHLRVDWNNVFSTHSDVTFSVFAGTSEEHDNVINHVATKMTSVSLPYSKALSDVFVTIKAVDQRGASVVYKAEVNV